MSLCMGQKTWVLAACVAGLASLTGCGMHRAGDSGVMTAEMQQGMTPDQVLASLQEGNERFVAGRNTSRDWGSQVVATSTGQYPKAIVLGCLDSRVPPEVVFDQGIGDLFVGRVAGNVETTELLGSMEFGTKLAGSKLIVVLGHTQCGAVKGAVAGAEMGHLTGLLKQIEVPSEAERRGMSDSAVVDQVVESNVRQTVRDIVSRSAVIADLVASGDLKVVGGVYDLDTGRVDWLDG